MNWWVFGVFSYLFLAFQSSLGTVLALPTNFGDVEPRFLLIPAVLVALHAPARTTTIAWFILGLLLDLTSDHGGLSLIGPYTLGYLGAAYVALQLRGSVLRRHPLTYMFLILICGGAVHLIVTGVLTARVVVYVPPDGWSAVNRLVIGALSLVYTAVIGFIVAVPMLKISPLLGFRPANVRGPRVGVSSPRR